MQAVQVSYKEICMQQTSNSYKKMHLKNKITRLRYKGYYTLCAQGAAVNQLTFKYHIRNKSTNIQYDKDDE